MHVSLLTEVKHLRRRFPAHGHLHFRVCVGGLTAISHCRLELERLTISCRCDAACQLNTQETINKLTVYAEDSRPTVNKQLGLTFNPTAIVLPPLPPTVEVAVLVNFSNRRLSLIC